MRERARESTMRSLRSKARLKGYLPPREDLTQDEAEDAILWLGQLRKGEDGTAERRAPDPPDRSLTPYNTLRGWRTRRP